MWHFEHTVIAEASVQTIWKLYSDISSWVEWDKEIDSASLEGPFIAGIQGVLQPKGQGPMAFELTEVDPPRRFAKIADIPGAGIHIEFIHRLQQTHKGTAITHEVNITGPNAEQLGPQWGARIAQGLPSTMQGLAAAAVKRERQQGA
ncbi:SRPBCC family protein [Paenibacillus sp. FJAT-26967]|uniref:SRPBCC family protein n=1 Tax=Paenibacillus sp. FJAT-26967 TaxID=1729690 RepID=UPI000839278B|nr:SRPBCC family protein [Paenibacillus sp. FJAT-26967]